MMTTHDVVQA